MLHETGGILMDGVKRCKNYGCNLPAVGTGPGSRCHEHHQQFRERQARDRAIPKCIVCGQHSFKGHDPSAPRCWAHQQELEKGQREYEEQQDRRETLFRAIDNAKAGANDVGVYESLREQLYCGDDTKAVLLGLLNYIIERKTK